MRVYLETYGCALNRGDSLIMETLLKDRGHEVVETPEQADVLILNTCTVRMDTEERMIERMKSLYRYGKKLVVAGCMATAEPGLVKTTIPTASLLSPQAVEEVVEVVESPGRVVRLEPTVPTVLPRIVEGKIAIVPVEDGCAGNCSFCITKNARRKLRSYPIRRIVESVREGVRRGAVEIELTGQDTAAYGLDFDPSINLAQVVNEVSSVEGDFMVRIGMMTPEQAMRILDDLVDALKREKVFKFVHLPVQSGDDSVLELMNRKYTVDQFRQLVKELRSKVPDLSVATDVIVGHPGEDEEAFRNTLKLMEELRFERVHLAKYSVRPNTRSASMKQIPDIVKKERMERANRVYAEVALREHSKYLGSSVSVITTELGARGSVIGRTTNYIPVVLREAVELGKWVKAKVEEASFFDLRGRLN
ncbi:2-methylthioadenine synthetase [Sulfodiicoccus acidiphilus]|uniref:tRNA-t(6)A37 methylthiotransferase n=2 Tax=Sulfodiicoccus acidiphilus TaxID=1670455 RepID=A0A348B428_9CREN|nr:tRNA (N(6)-L-threonylcarbamoyladenosine(37)-C(2))-methylthiotransferase [Sulfodiicoccus acidiphilus]BBD72930.1 2-methylthioadenine synthetase [Sulfodiicoccus acidiphilus]